MNDDTARRIIKHINKDENVSTESIKKCMKFDVNPFNKHRYALQIYNWLKTANITKPISQLNIGNYYANFSEFEAYKLKLVNYEGYYSCKTNNDMNKERFYLSGCKTEKHSNSRRSNIYELFTIKEYLQELAHSLYNPKTTPFISKDLENFTYVYSQDAVSIDTNDINMSSKAKEGIRKIYAMNNTDYENKYMTNTRENFILQSLLDYADFDINFEREFSKIKDITYY